MGAGVHHLGMAGERHESGRASPRHGKEGSWERARLTSALQGSVMGAGVPRLGTARKGHGSRRASPRHGKEASCRESFASKRCTCCAFLQTIQRVSAKRMIFEKQKACACSVDFESFEENFSHRCREAELWVGFGESPLTFGIAKVYDGAGIYMKGPYVR